jgi:hypothetical protein
MRLRASRSLSDYPRPPVCDRGRHGRFRLSATEAHCSARARDLVAGSALKSWPGHRHQVAALPQARKSPARRRRPQDPDSRSRPNWETGAPCFPITGQSGIGKSESPPKNGNLKTPGIRLPIPRRVASSRASSCHHWQLQLTRNILSREDHASALTGRLRHWQHAALVRVRERESMLLRVTSTNLNYTGSALGIYSAAPSIMADIGSALTGSTASGMRLLFRVREREHAAQCHPGPITSGCDSPT